MAESRGFHIGRRFWAFVGLAALLGYVAWIGAPYLRSVVVRDAAVTTWINATAAPIDGFLGDKPLHVGDSVGKDGLIAIIENPLQDATPVVRAEADLNKAKQHVSGLQELMTSLDATLPRALARRWTLPMRKSRRRALRRFSPASRARMTPPGFSRLRRLKTPMSGA